MRKLKLGLSVLLAVGVIYACGNKSVSEHPGYKKIEKGLYIKSITENKEGKAVTVGDILTMNMTYSNSNDSVIFDSQKNGQPVVARADSGKFVGDFANAFLTMKQGDSVSILMNADSFFLKIVGMPQIPDFVDSASMLNFQVGLAKVQTLEEMQAEADLKNAELQSDESIERDQYLADNGITTAPTETGLIFISKVQGTGKPAQAGKTVKVHYAGMLLNGTYFDTSIEELAKEQGLYDPRRDPYDPLEFVLGQGRVIKGWDEGIGMMKEGGKARLVIPSDIAYGANPRPGGPIKPYSTLVFDVELVEVVD